MQHDTAEGSPTCHFLRIDQAIGTIFDNSLTNRKPNPLYPLLGIDGGATGLVLEMEGVELTRELCSQSVHGVLVLAIESRLWVVMAGIYRTRLKGVVCEWRLRPNNALRGCG